MATGSERYETRSGGFKRTPAEWHQAARTVLLAMLDEQYAVTVREIEARASDRTFRPAIWPRPIDPHHFTNARNELRDEGVIERTTAVTRGHDAIPVPTWSRVPARGLRRNIEGAAARKRLLTARHAGWSRRGGNNLGLVGRAGENATHAALSDPACPLIPTGSTNNVLGVDLLGEIDNSGFYVDTSEPSHPVAIAVLVEVKNTRSHYYEDAADVRRFLAKAAHLQAERPDAFIFPLFICRWTHVTLWNRGERDGFLPAFVRSQLVLPDKDLDQDSLNEVSMGLGFEDLVLSDRPTNQHLGIARHSIAKYARERAELWRDNHTQYLLAPAEFDALPDVPEPETEH